MHLSLFASLFVLGLFLCYILKKKLQWTLGLSCYLHKEKLINSSKYALYLRFLRVATLCWFIDSAANPWPFLNELHDVVT